TAEEMVANEEVRTRVREASIELRAPLRPRCRFLLLLDLLQCRREARSRAHAIYESGVPVVIPPQNGQGSQAPGHPALHPSAVSSPPVLFSLPARPRHPP